MLVAELGNRTNNVLQLLASIAVFVLVLFVTYFVTKWIGNYQSVQLKNKNIKVVESVRIANGKYIQVVKIADEYITIAVCKDTVTFLTKLNEETIEKLNYEDNVESERFQDVLDKIKIKKK